MPQQTTPKPRARIGRLPAALANHTPQIIMRRPDSLRRYQRNARKHPPQQIALIKSSMVSFGFMNPMLLDRNDEIIAGHGRLEAALELGLEVVPTVQASHLSESQVRAYRLADNKIAEKSEWDEGLLQIELSALVDLDAAGELDFDIGAIGFETAELDLLIDQPDATEEAEVAPLPKPDPISRLGDLWILGNHKILCGSALDVSTYKHLLSNEIARLTITDPPYNVPVAGHIRDTASGHREFAMASGEMSNEEEFAAFLHTFLTLARDRSAPGSLIMSFMDWRHIAALDQAADRAGLDHINLCVWVKTNGGMGSLYRSQHELCGVYRAPGGAHLNNVQLGKHGRYRTNVWQYAGVNTFRRGRVSDLIDHPTVKPTAMIADAIRDVTNRDDIVLDPFGGSGSTLLAAERSGRRARLIELEPRYVDVAIRRWQDMTGHNAEHADTGETWNDRTNRLQEEVFHE
ncbi:MAG: DNA methyltransferase [Pseudomonadota bacterium]